MKNRYQLYAYEVGILAVDGGVLRREVWSYSAADAVTEVEVELNSYKPSLGQRVYRVRPRFAPPHEHLREDQ